MISIDTQYPETSPKKMHRITGSKTLTQTFNFCRDAHQGQFDKNGKPYYTHPLRIAQRVLKKYQGCELRAQAALLHDVLEDTDYTADDLRANGIPEPVIQAVIALTKTKEDKDYHMAILKVAANDIAIDVKIEDMADNSDPRRMMPSKTPEDLKRNLQRNQKYRHYKAQLENFREAKSNGVHYKIARFAHL